MRIVFIGTFGLYPKGTVRDRAVPLAQALLERGHEVTVLVPPWDNPGDSGRVVGIGGVKVINIRIPLAIPLWWHLLITLRLLKAAWKEQPDIIHLLKPKAFTGFVAMVLWLARRAGFCRVPYVIDSDDWEGKGGWNELQDYTWAQKRLFAFQEGWVLRHADSVTVASRTLARMATRLGVAPERLFYLPNGVAREQLERKGRSGEGVRRLHQLGQAPVILLYTRFFEFKLEYLLEVVESIFNQTPEARLLVVGKGLFAEERRLDEISQRPGIANRIAQVGWVERGKLGEYFAAADAAIYPLEDTLVNRTKCPVKLIDLLAAGVAVVAERVGESTQYIQNGETGLLVEPGDAEGLAAAVLRLLGDEPLRRRLSEQAREGLAARHTWGQVAQKAEKAYRVATGRR